MVAMDGMCESLNHCETGAVAGEKKTTTSVSPTVIGNAQIAVTVKEIAIGSVNVVVIVKKGAHAMKSLRNTDGSTRA